MEKEKVLTRVITDTVRLSFVNVWAPKAMQVGQPLKYSTALLIPKSNKALVKQLNAAIEEAKLSGVTKWGGKVPPVLKMPLRDGDAERPDDDNYKGHYFLNATSSTQPGVLGPDKNELLDKTKLYSGVYAKVDINFYPFNTQGNKGIACGLNNIMVVRDGEALAGKESAATAFKDVEVDNDNDGL